MAPKLGRPRNRWKPVSIPLTVSPKMATYLDDLVREQGYGNTRTEVARTLVWRGLEVLIDKGILDRRKGAH